MMGGSVRADPTEVPTVICHVETLQIVVVKPPQIDSVANGGRPHIFQQDSAPSHEALKARDSVAGNFHHHDTPDL
ncbi:hypothetical protein ACTXT7_007722 [Hymenolepis weldensis]